jgi:hypothetical protein
VKALIHEPAGKNLIAYREWLTPREIATAFTKATGMNAEVVILPKGSLPSSLPPSLKISIEDNMAYWNEFGYEGREDSTVVHPCNVSQLDIIVPQAAANKCIKLSSPPSLDSVEAYLKKYDWTEVFGSGEAL